MVGLEERIRKLKEKPELTKKEKSKLRELENRLKYREKHREILHQKDLKRRREKYKPIHKKNQRRRQNARAYKKLRQAIQAERDANGDVHGYYRVVLTRDREQVGELGTSRWLLRAMGKFNDYVREHNEGVICDKRYTKKSGEVGTYFKDEILVLKLIDPKTDDGVRAFRNEDGMFVDHIVSNNSKYAIIAKSDVYTPETYQVYGYSPMNDKKTGRWIYDNIIAKDCSRDNFKSVFVLNNKLIVQYDGDFDLVICDSKDECVRLYEGLRAEAGPDNKFVAFAGFVVNSMKSRYYSMISEKTGWSDNRVRACTT